MIFVTALCGGKPWRSFAFVLCCFFSAASLLAAQTETNSDISNPGQVGTDSTNAATKTPATNSAPSEAPTTPASIPEPPVVTPAPAETAPVISAASQALNAGPAILAALMTLASIGGFLLYQCGLTRAKNTAHTSTLLLVGVLFGLTGYWIGGFAVQTGGVGDAHAALAQPLLPAEKSALDHELGFTTFGHHWGIMGSSGFFLATDNPAPESIAILFLIQAAALTIAVAAALGAGLERARLLPMACCAYLIGVLIYPLLANWIWGGGWLAQLGRELDLGHGVVDLAGAGVVHETAGTLALVIAVILGPRHGRFRRNTLAAIPGHNVPFVILGSMVLLISWIAANAFAGGSLSSDPALPGPASNLSLAAINTLLAATGGMVISFVQASWQKKRPEPARLCRGLLGGAVASSGCAGLIDPWAAFVIGSVAALLVQAAMNYLERKRIDDPVGAAAVHGAGGAWGLLAVGLFANGSAGFGLNGVATPVRGLFFGGAWHQLAAQIIGCVTCFVVVYLLGYACVTLVQKILGNRVDLADEASGLDLPETGALGYQGDAEPEDGGSLG
jgi:ammonium transporter, Amt family